MFICYPCNPYVSCIFGLSQYLLEQWTCNNHIMSCCTSAAKTYVSTSHNSDRLWLVSQRFDFFMSSFYGLSFILGVWLQVCGASWYSYGARWLGRVGNMGRLGLGATLIRGELSRNHGWEVGRCYMALQVFGPATGEARLPTVDRSLA